MRFTGEPNLFVRFSERNRRIFGVNGILFDKNGIYETGSPLLCRVLSAQFKSDTTECAEEEPQEAGKLVKHCKKCDFVCENQGELLAHYRTAHPKGGTTE